VCEASLFDLLCAWRRVQILRQQITREINYPLLDSHVKKNSHDELRSIDVLCDSKAILSGEVMNTIT
jgi:hypothetical protein